MFGLTLTTPPATEPVSVATLKNHLRIPSNVTNEDATVLPMLITSARMQLETWMGRAFVTQTYTLSLDDWSKWNNFWAFYTEGNTFFPSAGQVPTNWWNRPLLLPVAPVQSVSSITYTDPNNVSQTLATSQYVVDTTREPCRIMLLSFPSLNYNTIPRIQIQFTAGYSSVPVDIQHGILLLAADFFRAREASTEFSYKELPFGFRNLVNKYRTWEVGDYGLQ
jgi:hypothetical protein